MYLSQYILFNFISTSSVIKNLSYTSRRVEFVVLVVKLVRTSSSWTSKLIEDRGDTQQIPTRDVGIMEG